MKTNYLVGLSVAGLILLNCQSSVAFNVYPSRPGATFRYQPASSYYFRGSRWQTEINYDTWVQPLPRGGTPILNNTLKFLWAPRSTPPFGQGWKFESANRDLEGFFEIKTYYACAFRELCGGPTGVGSEGSNPEKPTRLTTGVGAVFSLKYNPRGSDPTPLNNNLHWIQVVRSNRSFLPFVDNSGKFDNPYYDTATNNPWLAGRDFFIDRPYFYSPASPGIRNFFTADLYLVEELGQIGNRRRVKIHNGIRWGWKNTIDEFEIQKTFLDSLYSSRETDTFHLSGLTPGAKFYAEINNDIPGNVCNPNTYLEARDGSDAWRYDNDSSPVGDGFASALTGNVFNDGTINLTVGAYGDRGIHLRGKDGGKYELNVKVFKDENDFPYVIGAGSGGGGVGIERPGTTQQNPILPNAREGNWQIFRNVPGCRWYDPHTTYGFEFQALEDTLFTEILDFPVGDDDRFTVSVGDRILGEFGSGQNVDFVSLFGSGISHFKITDINSLFGPTAETAFPIQLAFNDRIGSFKMRPISQESSPTSVPESTSALGLLALGVWGIIKAMKIRLEK